MVKAFHAVEDDCPIEITFVVHVVVVVGFIIYPQSVCVCVCVRARVRVCAFMCELNIRLQT